ncbi:signal transduction histidine kinase [Actinoplanes octamycinicus]|uniref:histidine kinase n=1 Tax=Actinoplanes octamycinicus TaxID=135948 RepID=A0A7W7M7N6_9ACTN|nr:sensor histidine kinase [Actinoplanes octamycinicus]MBB4740013.1 signal transduction histidine kinase [Actinoplanes octamycinicus]GIE59409.1 two-component sensor histidine kinase [Actinoplanes octamycinicus]
MSKRGRDWRRPPGGHREDGCGHPGRPAEAGPAEAGPPWRRRIREAHNGMPQSAVVLTAVANFVGLSNIISHGGLYRPWNFLTTLMLLIGPIALVWRKRFPILVFVVASAATILFATQAMPHAAYAAAPGVALYSVARQGRRQAALICGVTAWAVWIGVTVGLSGPLGLNPGVRPVAGQTCLAAIGLGLMILLGGAARIRAENYAEQARTRAEQARAQEEQQRRQASEERLRIARELHDVLGHHLSLINVQAGVGLHLMDQRPEQAREALTAIKSASAEALREVRSVLGVLRTEGEAAPRQPALGLNRLAELTAAAGIPVRTTVTGDPRELPAEVDRAAYRIVQEALTNVRRHHAGPQPEADVAVGYLPAALYLSIRNDGPVLPEPPSPAPADGEKGSGITGMRARAESLGGRLEAGCPPTGGFLVTVILPTGRRPPSTADPDPPASPSAGSEAPASPPAGSDAPAPSSSAPGAEACGAVGDSGASPEDGGVRRISVPGGDAGVGGAGGGAGTGGGPGDRVTSEERR